MQKRSQQTRTQILDAALKLFSQMGYESCSVADICQAAGVSKGAFYHHFPTKQAVFLQLLDNWLEALDAQMSAAREGTQSVPEALTQMAELMKLVFEQAGGYLPMFLEFWTHASRDPAIWKAVIAPYHRYQAFFKSLIQQGVQEGSFQSVDEDTTSKAFVALAIGLLLQGVLDPEDNNWGEVSRQSIQYFLKGLKKDIP